MTNQKPAVEDHPQTPTNGLGTRTVQQTSDHPTSGSTASAGADSNAVRSASLDQNRPLSASQKRFFSDLNPEATFLNREGSTSGENRRPLNDDIGVWVDKREWEALVRQRNNVSTGRDYTFTISQGMHPDQRPHSAVLGPLIDVYFKKFHTILPLLDEAEFREQHSIGDVPEALIHAMCLVAAKDSGAEPHLRYGSAPSTLPPREFCSRLYASVRGCLRASCQYDKITLIQILALASLHNEGVDGAEEASMLLSQAMHHAQTMGIHLGQHSSTPHGPDSLTKRLFWCLYALDRLTSVMFGRPVLMSDIDIAIETFAPGESGFPAFEAWLKITEILNKILGFYRPHKSVDITGWEEPYPGLEEILDEVGAWQESRSSLATIHLFYLATAVLSHRSRGIKQVPRATPSSIRQRLCAIETIRLMESEHCRDLHALPLIPYAISLALSVSYQHLRQSQMHHQQEDARLDFRKCAKLLQSLRRTWSAADTMAALAMKVQDGLDRAPSLASFRIPRNITAARDSPDKPCAPDMSGARSGLLDSIPDGDERSGDEVQTSAATNNATMQDASIHEDGNDMFEGMDDIFGTYLDPNYPINLDDWSMVDALPPFDWNQVPQYGELQTIAMGTNFRLTCGQISRKLQGPPGTEIKGPTPYLRPFLILLLHFKRWRKSSTKLYGVVRTRDCRTRRAGSSR